MAEELKNQAKIEYAKSWFTYANILIIFAGIMFAAGGISYQNSISLLGSMNQMLVSQLQRVDQSILVMGNINDTLIREVYSNYSIQSATDIKEIITNQGEIFKGTLKVWIIFVIGGFIFSVLAIVFLIVGQNILKKLRE